MLKAELSKDGKQIIITADIEVDAQRSQKGKGDNLTIASSLGNFRTQIMAEIRGKKRPVTVGLNAFVPAIAGVDPAKVEG